MKKQHILGLIISLVFLTSASVFSATRANYSFEDSLKVYKNKPRFGLFGHGGYNLHISNMTGLPGIPSCCPKFGFGSAPGFAFGALYEHHLFDKWGIALRAGYWQIDGEFQSKESDWGIIDNKQARIAYTHYMTAQIGRLTVEPLAIYQAMEKLRLYGGLNLGTVLFAKYSQYEELTTPSNRGSFIDGTRLRNKSKGNIEEKSGFQAGITIGVGYEMPMNKSQSLLLQPEAFYRLNIISPVKETTWLTNSIHAGLAVKYKQAPPPPPPPLPPLEPPLPILNLPDRIPAMTVAVKATQIDPSGVESNNIDVKIEDFESFNFRPLLNYVFFDENSWKIPNRYKQLKKSETQIYSTNSLNELDALETYYHVLNIYGSRMREHPNTKITLVGTNCNNGVEKGRKELSQQRAETVKKYFVEVWGIEENRIKIQARNLPKKPSRDDDEPIFAYQENRRVEIISHDKELTAPVITNDTKRSVSASYIRFYPEAKSIAGIKEWKVVASQKGRILFKETGTGDLPEKLNWELTTSGDKKLTTQGEVAYNLEVKDNFGRKKQTEIINLPVNQITIQKKRKQKIKDKEYEYYSLILFDFGKSDLRKEHRSVVDFVKSRVGKDAKIYVKGYTDSMGDETTNKRLAQKRADAVGRRLKVPKENIIGIGESPTLLFDNKLPEGRFYCRTVQIEIEIEVK